MTLRSSLFITKPDLVSYLASTALRRGFRNSYAISYLNRGSVAANDIDLKVTFDNDIIPLTSSVPWDSFTLGDTTTEYVWHIDTLAPMEQATIMIIDSVSAEATLGKMAVVKSDFGGVTEDGNPSNNSALDLNEIIGSLDPNDKLVFPAGAILPTDTLTYKIRFQNGRIDFRSASIT